jgi:hypothetical protein
VKLCKDQIPEMRCLSAVGVTRSCQKRAEDATQEMKINNKYMTILHYRNK